MCLRRKKRAGASGVEAKLAGEKPRHKSSEDPRKSTGGKKRTKEDPKKSKEAKQLRPQKKPQNEERPIGAMEKEAKKSPKSEKSPARQCEMMQNPFYHPKSSHAKMQSEKAKNGASKSELESNAKESARDSSQERQKSKNPKRVGYDVDVSASKSECASKEQLKLRPLEMENADEFERDFANQFMNESRKTETSARPTSFKVEVAGYASEASPMASKPSVRERTTQNERTEEPEEQEGGCNLELNASHLAQVDKRRRRQRPEDDTLYGIDPKMPEKDFSPVNTISDRTAFAMNSLKATV